MEKYLLKRATAIKKIFCYGKISAYLLKFLEHFLMSIFQYKIKILPTDKFYENLQSLMDKIRINRLFREKHLSVRASTTAWITRYFKADQTVKILNTLDLARPKMSKFNFK